MKVTRTDHVFVTIGRLGTELNAHLLGGDEDTWGQGAERVGDIDVLTPTLGTTGPHLMICNGETIDLKEWEIGYHELSEFLRSALGEKVNDEELDFILWETSETTFGEEYGEKSGFQLDEWPVPDLEERLGHDLKGRLMVHFNKRYDSAVNINENGCVDWADDVDPDDDSQFIAVFKGTEQ